MENDERLEAAMQEMEPSNLEDWKEPIMQIYSGEGEQFFVQVEKIKKMLELFQRYTKMHSMTQLRGILERLLTGYIGKTHLAVALVELGYNVYFEDSHYFHSNFDDRPFISLERKRTA